MLQKSETNNAIITTLSNVRKHPNADRLQLATVLGTQIVVGLDTCEGDPVVYFDSNLRLSPEYLYWNNLYAKSELNFDKTQKGYFGNNGRVKAQKLRGEISNGLAIPVKTLGFIPEVMNNFPSLEIGDEFTHINGIKICEKYITPCSSEQYRQDSNKLLLFQSVMFHRHWDTKQLMREKERIVPGVIYVEEKIHGTSGRVANVLCHTGKRWWQFWKSTWEWKVVSGTRRVESIQNSNHMYLERKEIEEKVAPHLHKGEQLYYEIFGHTADGKEIQQGFSYGCSGGQYKIMLYRITITTLDGYCIDLNREQVYRRAEELGLEKPNLLYKAGYSPNNIEYITNLAKGLSALDANTMREGIVVWFQDADGNWTCLKHKSEEYLLLESKQKDENIGDVEDNL